MTKLQNMVEDIESRIKWETEDIEKLTVDIKNYVAQCTPGNMAMFIPGKIEELQRAIDRRKAYQEQLDMLRFLGKEEG